MAGPVEAEEDAVLRARIERRGRPRIDSQRVYRRRGARAEAAAGRQPTFPAVVAPEDSEAASVARVDRRGGHRIHRERQDHARHQARGRPARGAVRALEDSLERPRVERRGGPAIGGEREDLRLRQAARGRRPARPAVPAPEDAGVLRSGIDRRRRNRVDRQGEDGLRPQTAARGAPAYARIRAPEYAGVRAGVERGRHGRIHGEGEDFRPREARARCVPGGGAVGTLEDSESPGAGVQGGGPRGVDRQSEHRGRRQAARRGDPTGAPVGALEEAGAGPGIQRRRRRNIDSEREDDAAIGAEARPRPIAARRGGGEKEARANKEPDGSEESGIHPWGMITSRPPRRPTPRESYRLGRSPDRARIRRRRDRVPHADAARDSPASKVTLRPFP